MFGEVPESSGSNQPDRYAVKRFQGEDQPFEDAGYQCDGSAGNPWNDIGCPHGHTFQDDSNTVFDHWEKIEGYGWINE